MVTNTSLTTSTIQPNESGFSIDPENLSIVRVLDLHDLFGVFTNQNQKFYSPINHKKVGKEVDLKETSPYSTTQPKPTGINSLWKLVKKMEFEYETPRVDDYVRWTTSTGMVHEGWVYFVVMNITIELGVKDKPECEYTVKEKHKKIHNLLICQN